MLKAKDKLDATMECPACGGGASMSVTKNMGIFAYCKEIVDPEKNEKCGYRAFLGRTKSKEIIREYNENMKGIINVQTEYEQGNIENYKTKEDRGGQSDLRNKPNGRPEQHISRVTERGDDAEQERASVPASIPASRGIGGAVKHFFTASE